MATKHETPAAPAAPAAPADVLEALPRPRGRKRVDNQASSAGKDVYDVSTPSLPKARAEGTVIVKLNLGNDHVEHGPVSNGPCPHAYNGFDAFTDFSEDSEKEKAPLREPGRRALRILMEFEEKCKNMEWPDTTSVHCYWCCHQFNCIPVGIPVSFHEDVGKFMVYGCFCSCECAAAFNLASRESADEILLRHAFINTMARQLGYTCMVRPAPDRLALTIFGGPMGIDEFRTHNGRNTALVINFPPMMITTQQVEELDHDFKSEYRYIPIDTERIDKYREKIKLKRSKPLANFAHTLDHSMNLKFM